MRRLVRPPHTMSIADNRPQLRNRREAILGILFVLSLVMGAMLWDEVAFAGQPLTHTSQIGLALSAGACAFVLGASRRRWPLLLCAVLFASIRIPNVWLGSPFPDGLDLLVDCFAVSISLFAVFFRTEIAELISPARQNYRRRRSSAQAAPVALVTLSHARAASTSICTVESLPSSPA
jgi:hypothetical protein